VDGKGCFGEIKAAVDEATVAAPAGKVDGLVLGDDGGGCDAHGARREDGQTAGGKGDGVFEFEGMKCSGLHGTFCKPKKIMGLG